MELKYELHLQLDRRNLSDGESLRMFRKLEELKNQTKQTGGATSDFTDSKLSEQLKCSERQVQKLRELTKRADNETLRKVLLIFLRILSLFSILQQERDRMVFILKSE